MLLKNLGIQLLLFHDALVTQALFLNCTIAIGRETIYSVLRQAPCTTNVAQRLSDKVGQAFNSNHNSKGSSHGGDSWSNEGFLPRL